ncbi:MAG: ATPase [Planctomycetales bacterium]|nr:ATPase [Planctomycetales bacterium]
MTLLWDFLQPATTWRDRLTMLATARFRSALRCVSVSTFLLFVFASGDIVAGANQDDAQELLSFEPFRQVAFYDAFLGDEGSEDDGNEDKAKEDPSYGDRLDKLEENYSDLAKNYEKLGDENADLKKKLKDLAGIGHGEETMQVNGRIHVDHWAFPESSPAINVFENHDPSISPQDRIGFRRLRFGVKGDLWKTMVYKIEMEFAGGNKTEFRDAYLGWEELPILQTLLVGNQKRPYGLDHLNSSRYNVFLERPFVIESFNQDSRRFGIQSYGVSEDEAWNWRYGVFNQRLIQDEGNYVSDHYQMELASRLANTFWYDEASSGRGYGHWAVAGSWADPDGSGIAGRATNEARFRHRPEARSTNRWLDTGTIAGADDYTLLGLENVWNFGPLQLVGEYQSLWLQRNGGTDIHLHGSYAYVSYFLTGEHIPWERDSGTLGRVKPIENFFLVDTCSDGVRGGWGAWQVAYRWSYADFNDEDILGGVGQSHTLGLNWHWNPYARMQFNAIYGEIDDHEGFDDADPPNSLGALSGHYAILGTRFMVDF